jgi:hypothetical protein
MSKPVVKQVDTIPTVDTTPVAPVTKSSAPVSSAPAPTGSYTFLYGIVGLNTEDVTSIVYTDCVVNNIATIPGGDDNRAGLFQVDPVFGYIKEVYIVDPAGTQTSYDSSVNIIVNFSTNTITTTPFEG